MERALLMATALVAGCSWAQPFPDTMPAQIEGDGATTALQAGDTLTVLSWNLQYSAGRSHHFFYDGGDAVHVPAADVEATVDAIAEVIREVDPDLLLLQEVDRDSARTGRLDQLPPLVEAGDAARWTTATYHRCPYVPVPFGDALGRVDMHLALASRGELRGAERIQLPLLDEPAWRQAFNLRRAVLWAELPIEGLDQPLAVAVTHLSAFSHGDGTMARQVAVLQQWMDERRDAGQPFVLAGDLNLLPPGDDPSRLGEDVSLYDDESNPMDALVATHSPATPADALLAEAHRTYLPFGASEPDRKIDWVFTGPQVEVIETRVLREHSDISDHLPILVTLRVGHAPEADADEAQAPDQGEGR